MPDAIYALLASPFHLWDYAPTHGQLLFRSLPVPERAHNVDIIFRGVTRLHVPDRLEGLEIAVVPALPEPLAASEGFALRVDARHFQLREDRGTCWYLNAMCFGVYHNRLATLETSLNRYDWGDLGELKLWYAD